MAASAMAHPNQDTPLDFLTTPLSPQPGLSRAAAQACGIGH